MERLIAFKQYKLPYYSSGPTNVITDYELNKITTREAGWVKQLPKQSQSTTSSPPVEGGDELCFQMPTSTILPCKKECIKECSLKYRFYM